MKKLIPYWQSLGSYKLFGLNDDAWFVALDAEFVPTVVTKRMAPSLSQSVTMAKKVFKALVPEHQSPILRTFSWWPTRAGHGTTSQVQTASLSGRDFEYRGKLLPDEQTSSFWDQYCKTYVAIRQFTATFWCIILGAKWVQNNTYLHLLYR